MVHPKWKRHLSFEELDTRIAMNADAVPLRSIAFESFAFESPTRTYGPRFEIRSSSLSVSSASIDMQPIAIRQLEIRQEAIPSFLTKYEIIRFNARRLFEEMMGEGEDRGGSEHARPPSQDRDFGNFAEVEGQFVVKPALPVRGSDALVAPLAQLNAGLNTAKPNLPPATNNLIPNQAVARPEPIVQRPPFVQFQTQPQTLTHTQPNTQIAASAIRTTSTSASPLTDTLTAKSGFNSVSFSPRDIVLQAKSTLNEIAVGPSTAKAITQSGIVGPKTESPKPTKDGMLSFTMDTGSVRTKSTPTDNEQTKVTRVRSQHQNEVLLRQMQKAQVDSLINEQAVNARGLPVPKGMIEIRDHADNSQRQGVVSQASTNPFEILQLFIGSSNMVQSQDALASQATNTFGISSVSTESTELATKEDILVTLGIGAVLAIAIRESKIRHQKTPFFATVRHLVAKAT